MGEDGFLVTPGVHQGISKDGHVGTTKPTFGQFVTDVFGRANVLLDLVIQQQAKLPIGLPAALADHTPLYYVLHCWNDFAAHSQ